MPLPEHLQPTPLEVTIGAVFGWTPPEPLPEVPASLTPLEALEEALAPALARGRCFVAFSGGRDSSMVLAIATTAARHRGLPDPVPLTLRFPGRDGVEEDDWQEEVVSHLRLADWERIELSDDLDMLGAVARRWLLRHRCPWPANGHSFAPLYAAARGGSLVTGMDGDGLLDSWQWARTAAVLARRIRPGARDLLHVAKAAAPRRARHALMARRARAFAGLPWPTETAKRTATERWAAFLSAEPSRWDRRLAWYPGQRHLRVLAALMADESAAGDVAIVHPLLDLRFLAAFGRTGGRAGYLDRTEAVRMLAGALLPERTVTRPTKADFTWAFWGPESRRFAEAWDGSGVDPDLVDATALRAAWLAPKPDFRSANLLQAAWLASAGEARQEVDDSGQ